jgi:glucuronate isomerase
MSAMKPFLGEDFLLPCEAARRLFHDHAKAMPILDFHSHLPPRSIAEDRPFTDIAEAWLGGDHYKWRAMRANGVPEELVTGKAPGREKFRAWAATMPRLLGNPLYHWAHLELKRYFGIDAVLDERSADRIFDECGEKLRGPGFGARALLSRMGVKAVCSTDDPADSLEWHDSYAKARKPGEPALFPTFRPDKALAIEKGAAWLDYLGILEGAAGFAITRYEDLVRALDERHAYFHERGCRASDHALLVPPMPGKAEEAARVFSKARAGEAIRPEEAELAKACLLAEVGRMNAKRGWVMQLHIGAMRDVNSAMFEKLGPDSGYDSVSDLPVALPLARLLDSLARAGGLPKTMLYTLNQSANDALVTLMGGFQDGTIPGKLQFGSAWWFNDHIDGMDAQMRSLAANGLLSRFVGMLTDSRSFLSFPRHEYFRRILSRLVGSWMEEGLVPPDFALTGSLVRDVSYGNAARYFELPFEA